MTDIWFTSDTHFMHENIIQYCGRPFKDAEFMDEFLIGQWNMLIKPQDKVYHLGDVACGFGGDDRKLGNLLRRLNGHKRLNPGNHDNLKSVALQTHFEKIEYWSGQGQWPFFTHHVPLNRKSFRGKDVVAQVHGHTHNNFMEESYYINVCVDVTNFRPMHLDEILDEVKKIK